MRNPFASVCVLASVLLLACGNLVVRVPMLRPAEADISGIHKVAVLGLREGPEVPPQLGREAGAALVEQLAANGYFTVVDRSDPGQLSRELSLPPGALFEPAGLQGAGRTLGVDAVLLGELDYLRFSEERGVDMLEVPVPAPPAPVVVAPPPVVVAPPPVVVAPPPPHHKPRHRPPPPVVVAPPPPPPPPVMVTRPFPFVVRKAELQVTLKLVRVEGLGVVFAKQIALASAAKIYVGPQPDAPRYHSQLGITRTAYLMRDLPPPESFTSFFAREIPLQFVPHIVPTRYTKVIEFARGSNPHLKRGLEFVKANAWEPAQKEFSQGLTIEPGSAALHYNLAVTLEAVGDLPAAQREYEQALRLEPSNRKYQQGFRSVQDTIAEQQRLSQQVGAPPAGAPPP